MKDVRFSMRKPSPHPIYANSSIRNGEENEKKENFSPTSQTARSDMFINVLCKMKMRKIYRSRFMHV